MLSALKVRGWHRKRLSRRFSGFLKSTGGSPTWDITGLVYLPNSNVTFSGAVGKSDNGAACFVLVTNTLLINGTANILNDMGQCAQAGLSMPQNQVGGRGQLVN